MPSILLSASYDICASHQLTRADWSQAKNNEIFGKCANLHGHQYRLEVCLEGEVDSETGMLLNGYTVDSIVTEKVLSQFDHHHLNTDIPFFKDHLPTAEWIAVWVFNELKNAFPKPCKLKRVRIYETPMLYAEYSDVPMGK